MDCAFDRLLIPVVHTFDSFSSQSSFLLFTETVVKKACQGKALKRIAGLSTSEQDRETRVSYVQSEASIYYQVIFELFIVSIIQFYNRIMFSSFNADENNHSISQLLRNRYFFLICQRSLASPEMNHHLA